MRIKIILWLFVIALLSGGYFFWKYSMNGLVVSDFHPFVNYKAKDNVLVLDLSDAVYRGIEIPTVKQLPGGKFAFTFKVKNKFYGKRKLYYKIYYQDETYKYPEYTVQNKFRYENPFDAQNFYGSWGETDPGFKPTKEVGWGDEISVTDSFRIVGNPRNEENYFGRDDHAGLSSVKIANMINYIHTREDWMQQINLKARDNGLTVEQQVYRDAVWQIDDTRKLKDANNRWKRNPRTGKYKFMLVVTTEPAMNALPPSVRNITAKENEGNQVNPFYYFLYGAGSKDRAVNVSVAKEQLDVKAKLDPGSGMYVDPFEFMQSGIDTVAYCPTCGTDSLLFRRAQFEQFFYYEDKGHIFPTIPVAADVTGDNYTREQYANNHDYYSPESVINHSGELVRDYIHNARRPCETVSSDSSSHTISIFNPGNTDKPYRKENVGVRSRIGFTYGTYLICAKFPKLLSKDHVWNGLSNAVWLLYQSDDPWNVRNTCETQGYIPKDDTRGAKAVRSKTANYSEIDMEMVKTSRNWPKSSYGEQEKPDDDHAANTDDVIVACSNWDLACMQPPHYVTGVVPLFFEKHRFELHRWDSWYQALTIKTPEKNADLFGSDYYWYEIEWMPDHITWRVGPDKEHLHAVGYMSSDYTTIPTNQMSLIISQKFPDSDWWVPAPYDQRYIPYPKNPLEGKIISVEVE